MNCASIRHICFVTSAFAGVIINNLKLHSEYDKAEKKPSVPERMAMGYLYSLLGVYYGLLGLMYLPIYIPTYLLYKISQSNKFKLFFDKLI